MCHQIKDEDNENAVKICVRVTSDQNKLLETLRLQGAPKSCVVRTALENYFVLNHLYAQLLDEGGFNSCEVCDK